MVKKKRTRDKESQRASKARYTNRANLYYKEVISPLERAWKRAMIARQYQEAGELFMKIREAKKDHRQLLMRRELARIK